MAMDTDAKKWSAMHTTVPFYISTPLPAGAIDQGDKQELMHVYRGILAQAPLGAPFGIAFNVFVPGVGFAVKIPSVEIDVTTPGVSLAVK